VALHETRVDNPVVRRGGSDTTVALLQDDGEDEPSIHACGAGDGLDAVGHVLDLLVRVVFNIPLSAGALQGALVGLEPVKHCRLASDKGLAA
jgi:hypothetical protein